MKMTTHKTNLGFTKKLMTSILEENGIIPMDDEGTIVWAYAKKSKTWFIHDGRTIFGEIRVIA